MTHSRLRTRSLLWLATLLLALAPSALADETQIASDEEVEKALAIYKTEYRAKGLKGDDKLMQRDFAIKNLVKLQHPSIVKELGKVARSGDIDLATLGVIYLGEMRALPGEAGPYVVAAMKKHKRDPILLMSALDTLGYIRYYGAEKDIVDLMKHKDFAVKKYAIRSAGWLQDIRMMPALLKLLGIEAKNEKQGSGKDSEKEQKKSGGKEETSEGYSWEGVEVNYDTGTPGDHDQKMAEKIGKEKLAQNKAAATAGKGGGGGGTAGGSVGGSSAGPRGGTSRTLEELVPTILRALKAMTGEEFESPKGIRLWLRVNQAKIEELEKRFERLEKEQK